MSCVLYIVFFVVNNKGPLIVLSALCLGTGVSAHENLAGDTRNQIATLMKNSDNTALDADTTIFFDLQNKDLEISPNELSKCISESVINYFNNEVTTYSFSEQEQKVLKQEIAKYFAKNKVFSVKGNIIVININKSGIYNMFECLLPYFIPKLKRYSKLGIKVLGIKTCTDIVYKDMINRKGNDAEILYIEEICTLLKYIVDGIKSKYGGDMTIGQGLDSILGAFPNKYIKEKYYQYNKLYLNMSISDIKRVRIKLMSP